jgi:hypothetical protein
VYNLVAGIYQFELKITNAANFSARDIKTLTVKAATPMYFTKWINSAQRNISLTATGNQK